MKYEVKTIEGKDFAVVKVKSFKDWVLCQGINPVDIVSWSESKKYSWFMRWKHGLDSLQANEALEQTEREVIKFLNEMDKAHWQALPLADKFYFEKKHSWHRYTARVWQEILSGAFADESIEKIVKIFGAEAEGGNDEKAVASVVALTEEEKGGTS